MGSFDELFSTSPPPTPYTYFSKSQEQSVFYDNIVVKCFHRENTMFLP